MVDDPAGFAFDVFLSHASEDKPQVRGFARRLEAAGLRVWLDEEQLAPGFDPKDTIPRGLDASRHVLIWVTRAWLDKIWTNWELELDQLLSSLAGMGGDYVLERGYREILTVTATATRGSSRPSIARSTSSRRTSSDLGERLPTHRSGRSMVARRRATLEMRRGTVRVRTIRARFLAIVDRRPRRCPASVRP